MEITELYIIKVLSFCCNQLVDYHAITCKQTRSFKASKKNYLQLVKMN